MSDIQPQFLRLRASTRQMLKEELERSSHRSLSTLADELLVQAILRAARAWRNSRNKGAAAEREIAKLLFDELGMTFKRDLEQYRAGDTGDLICDEPFPL